MTDDEIPYSRQWVDEDDIAAVADALRSDWLTTGPRIEEFERSFARYVGAGEAVAVNSGTAALHAALAAAGVGPGDEVIVPAITFAATANAAVYLGARPVFADVDPRTLLVDPESVAAKINGRTKTIVAVDYAGQPADYDALRSIAAGRDLALVADACHALGASAGGRRVGTLADVSCFSFHAIKPITTGEGGMIATNDAKLAARMRAFRNHGIDRDHRQRDAEASWEYEMVELGNNYRLTDVQAALGLSQLSKADRFLARRRQIARRYDAAFATLPGVRPLETRAGVEHAHHLYVVRLQNRARAFRALRERGVRAAVHYPPVYRHPYYQQRFGCQRGLCPLAEAAYEEILSLPMFARLTDDEVERVIAAVGDTLTE